MRVHLVEVALSVDVRPGAEDPFQRPGRGAELGIEAMRRFLDHLTHMLHEPAAGDAAKFQTAGGRVPAANIGQLCPWMSSFVIEDAFTELHIQFRSIGPNAL